MQLSICTLAIGPCDAIAHGNLGRPPAGYQQPASDEIRNVSIKMFDGHAHA
jgi:hypothetical protein